MLALAGVVATALALRAAPARAQTDVRLIRPDVMLLVDTSGSMEWRNGVANSTCMGADGGSCNLCSNGAALCSPACPVAEQRNRWTTALEVLTGTIQSFSCRVDSRTDPTAVDYLYPVPFHHPLSGGAELWSSPNTQSVDGILDAYRERVRFGFMSFDNDYRTGLQATDGLFSYGANTTFLANGCAGPTMPVNVGARRASNGTSDTVPGGLISVGAPTADTTTLNAINDAIQSTLIGTSTAVLRPYGGTPIAGMLADALYYWTTNTDVTDGSGGGNGDPYFRCRGRFNILITDGAPNMDFRPSCEGGGQCPYQRPDQTAMTMAMSGGSAPGAKTFVIAFNATDPNTVAALQPIALAGGTNNVLYASDRATLQSSLSAVLDAIAARTSTRTAPTFSSTTSTTTGSRTLYQFQSSFAVNSGLPWEGVLERRRTECTTGPMPVPVDQPKDPTRDDFGLLLQASQRGSWGQRKLWTFVPPNATTVTQMRATFANSSGGPSTMPLDSSVAPGLFGVTTAAQRDTLLAWLRGDPGTVRETRPLGDIYHSNPLVLEPPQPTLPDQTFTAYTQRVLPVQGFRRAGAPVKVGTRETALYVGTNDGILHAFNVDTGEEMWGFVPPYLTGSINAMYPANHQYGVDGSPVARELVYGRSTMSLGDQSSWRTVLVAGLRGGGGAYEALDVTDPYNPRFLWQFTDANMVTAYGTPALGTAFMRWNGVASERAVAVIPGGQGTAATTCATGANPWPLAGNGLGDSRISYVDGAPRATGVHCWQRQDGQFLYVVDVETGTVIRKFGPTGSPVVGSPALYLGTQGTVATRAYVGDADGGVWRVDMSDPDPNNWRMGVLFDLFSGGTYTSGQPVVSPPVLSVDTNGDTLVVAGTGDPDTLEGTDQNKVAVFREHVMLDSNSVVAGISASRVWELKGNTDPSSGFYAGERLTGNLTLFSGVLYFGTFVPVSTADACQMGYSRLWGVSLTQTQGALPAPMLQDTVTGATVRYTRDLNGNGTTDDDLNSVLYGVGITRRPTCGTPTTSTDAYFNSTYTQMDSMSGGDFRLVIQSGTGGTATGGFRTNVVSRPLQTPVLDPQIAAWAVVFE